MDMERGKHWIYLLLICVATAVVYAKITGAYFCAYDDFMEVHRAAFEDSRNPSLVFTTPHMNSPLKYRPISRLAGLWTYYAGDGNPLPFRIRNLGFHLANVVLVYALGWLLFGSIAVSAAAALLFGVHPIANQSVIGASWTNTMAHTLFLLALVLFVVSIRAKHWLPVLFLAVAVGFLGVLTYDPEVSVFALMAAAMVIFFFTPRRGNISARFITAFGAIFVVLMGAYFTLRMLFAPRGLSQAAASVPGLQTTAVNIIMYLAALVTPVDSVLANEWFKTPLPSEIVMTPAILVAGGLALLVFLGLGVAVFRAFTRHPGLQRAVDWPAVAFLLCAVGAPLSTLILFQSHPSETYLYLSVAFYALLVAYLGKRATLLLPSTNRRLAVYGIAVLVLAANFGLATAIRNGRVAQCATTALRIAQSLPPDLSPAAAWTVFFEPDPESQASRPYGFYAHRGIYTIGDTDEALTAALQLWYRSDSITGKLLEPGPSGERCPIATTPHQMCLKVFSDGRIEPLSR